MANHRDKRLLIKLQRNGKLRCCFRSWDSPAFTAADAAFGFRKAGRPRPMPAAASSAGETRQPRSWKRAADG
jgi:hypothetical protein